MRLNFKSKLLMVAVIPCLIVAVFMCGGTLISLNSNMTMEISETLRATAYSLDYEDTQKTLNGYKENLGIDVTIFSEDKRITSTVEGAVGTNADPTIYAEVKSGNEYFSTNANVNGEEYFGYYIPIYDENNTFIGMSFAGKPTGEAQKIIGNAIKLMVSSTLAVIVGVIVCVFVVARYMTKLMKNSTDLISEVSKGNFDVSTDKKVSADEIGEIYKQAGELAQSLRKTITSVKGIADKLNSMSVDMSNSTGIISCNTSEINRAVEEVANSAMDQAQNVQNAFNSMEEVNEAVVTIQEQINALNAISESMQNIEGKVMEYIDTLKSINLTTNKELKEVEEKIAKTSEAIKNIQKATDIIKNIASEIKLLSLNASIESARAGEAGKGFAVVATQVSKLAKESDIASGDIEEILELLMLSYEDVTSSVNRLVSNMNKQSVSISDTYEKIVVLDENITNVANSINVISDSCNTAEELSKNMIITFDNLSAISQENASACEETNASIQELNATITNVNDEADTLKEISKALVEQVEIFKV